MTRKRKPLPADRTLQVDSLAHDGRGIARVDDKIVFVFGALPGETVRAKYIHSLSRYDEAQAVEVLEPSSARQQPSCAHFGLCGGCQLQHLQSPLQIQYKQSFLADQLVHQAKVHPEQWLEPLQGDSIGYRQKARLGVRYVFKKQSLLVGFREQNNNKIATLESCQVLDPRLGLKIKDLRDLITLLEGREQIPQIELAIGDNEVALVFRHLQPLSDSDVQKLVVFCQSNHFSLYLQGGSIASTQKIWPQDERNYLTYTLADQNLSFQFHPLDFTQVNASINQKMINQALALLQPNETDQILDLFCGLGNFSLPLAQKAGTVVGVEGSQEAVERATKNAQLNHLENVSFFKSDLSQGSFLEQPWANKKYTKILLDPPRCGAQEVIKQFVHFDAKAILYVSCNPATFARDAAILVHQQGYQLTKVGVMDMFAHTAHVETMGLFQRM